MKLLLLLFHLLSLICYFICFVYILILCVAFSGFWLESADNFLALDAKYI
uniref:Uncharacterized protein n=1 Tax=Anguilla anguilla TaxID=7936 RepID=A0A0E9Q6F1_ANGAN